MCLSARWWYCVRVCMVFEHIRVRARFENMHCLCGKVKFWVLQWSRVCGQCVRVCVCSCFCVLSMCVFFLVSVPSLISRAGSLHEDAAVLKTVKTHPSLLPACLYTHKWTCSNILDTCVHKNTHTHAPLSKRECPSIRVIQQALCGSRFR